MKQKPGRKSKENIPLSKLFNYLQSADKIYCEFFQNTEVDCYYSILINGESFIIKEDSNLYSLLPLEIYKSLHDLYDSIIHSKANTNTILNSFYVNFPLQSILSFNLENFLNDLYVFFKRFKITDSNMIHIMGSYNILKSKIITEKSRIENLTKKEKNSKIYNPDSFKNSRQSFSLIILLEFNCFSYCLETIGIPKKLLNNFWPK